MAVRIPRVLRLVGRTGLAAEVLLTYVRARRAMREQDLRRVVHGMRAHPAARALARDTDARSVAGLVGRAVQRTLAPLPADTRCLTQALVVTAMLARRDIPSTLVIAVRAPGDTFGAHAWVELGGSPLLPPASDGYARLIEL
jgi:hypothetical protein